MNPQGSGLINLEQYASMKDRINGAGSCSQLQIIASQILTSLNAENAAILSQLEKLAPIAALLEAPTSPEDVITWVSDFINGVLQPLYAPALVYPAQITARTAAILELTNTIAEKAQEFSECSITLPPP